MDWAAFESLPRREISTPSGTVSAIDVGPDSRAQRRLLLLHGNPTWSYQWRQFLPVLLPTFRCIAPDLPGFGWSQRRTHYDWDVHWKAVDAVSATASPAVVVGHDWGGALAAYLAVERPERVEGVVLMEPQLLPEHEADYQGARRERFEALRDPQRNRTLIEDQNVMVEQIQAGVLRRLTHEEMEAYRSPFRTRADRVAIRRFVEMKPIGEESETFEIFKRIEAGLRKLDVPVLLLTVDPGAIVQPSVLARISATIPRLTIRALGPGRHHFHEDYAQEASAAILEWAHAHGLA